MGNAWLLVAISLYSSLYIISVTLHLYHISPSTTSKLYLGLHSLVSTILPPHISCLSTPTPANGACYIYAGLTHMVRL